MSLEDKAQWKQLSDESVRQYNEQKTIKNANTVYYYLTEAGLAAANKLKKKAVVAMLSKAKKTKTLSSPKAKTTLKSALKKSIKRSRSKVVKRVTFSRVKKCTKNVKVGMHLFRPVTHRTVF